MHHNERLHDERLERVLRERLLPAVYRARHPLVVAAWSSAAAADAAATDPPVVFDEAVRQRFTPIAPGDGWGTPWGTTWRPRSARCPRGADAASLARAAPLDTPRASSGYARTGSPG